MPALQITKKPEPGQDGQPQYEVSENPQLPAWDADATGRLREPGTVQRNGSGRG